MLSLGLSLASPASQRRSGGSAPGPLTLITPTTVIAPATLIQGI